MNGSAFLPCKLQERDRESERKGPFFQNTFHILSLSLPLSFSLSSISLFFRLNNHTSVAMNIYLSNQM